MSRNLFLMAIFVFLFLMGLGIRKDALADQKIMIGWLEAIYLPEYDFVLTAKIDTGAKNCSIHAMDVNRSLVGDYVVPYNVATPGV